ncbi:MAG TPA: FkbM family methyltransferase [Candidatus Paceibacterota bacterium]|nr:FkbM family methyltransferase [Candidatus Paceibacterota bacterium]
MKLRNLLTPSRYFEFALRILAGGQITYSQLGEDLILKHLMHGQKSGTYIDIGANNPRFLSNTYLFYKMGWKGLCVDPNPSKINAHKIFRPKDIAVICGAGPKGTLTYYLYSDDGLNTSSEETMESYAKKGIQPIKKIETSLFPLHELAKAHLPHLPIDILSLDTEGNDMAILTSNDWSVCSPRYIILETLEYSPTGLGAKLNPMYDPYLVSLGYTPIAETHINTIYRKS